MTTINVEHVNKQYTIKGEKHDRVTALHDITLEVKDGESLAILGPSGCGKTTLLRVIAGLEQVDSGAVYHNGELLDDIAPRERVMGMVFQDYALIPHWEARRTVGFFLRIRQREREVPERVEQVSRITGFGIDALMDRLPRTLSGGEKQRVAIARAFARDLHLLLFDEPFANLDAQFRTHARVELRRLLDNFDVTSIIVTHDQQEAATLSERIVLMRAGHIEQIGPFEQLHDNPQNVFAAQFVGTPTINLFDGVVQDERWQHPLMGSHPLPQQLREGRQVRVGLRPQYFQLATEDAIAATVVDLSLFFSERYVLLELERSGVLWQIKCPWEQAQGITRGDVLHCKPLWEHALYFDALTDQRLF